jgi:predicted  nucleic acid-binding Zn-ribbon protein
VRADPFAQLKLLDLQELDSRLDALRHQAGNLPETAELRRLSAEMGELRTSEGALRTEVDDLTREQRRADADVEQVKARRARDQQRLDSGGVSNPKDLERLQHELVSLDRRVSELEDAELEVMEGLETAQAALTDVRSRMQQVATAGRELTTARDDRLAALQAEAEKVTRERSDAAAGLPADLLALYERLRQQRGGVGAAHLRARRCEGCSLELDSAELARIAGQRSDEVVHCEECGRILVRTGESGL